METKKYFKDLTLENKSSEFPNSISTPIDIELNGYYTKIRKSSIFNKEISLPENFSIVYDDFDDNGMYSLDEKVMISPDYSDNCDLYFINLNPKLIDFVDLGFDRFFEVQNIPGYYNFIVGNCTSIFIGIRDKKINSLLINYIYKDSKETRNETIYVDL